MMWYNDDSQRIYDRYLNNNYNDVLFDIDRVFHNTYPEIYKSLYVCLPVKFVKQSLKTDPSKIKRLLFKRVREFFKNNPKWKPHKLTFEYIRGRYIQDMMVGNDKFFYASMPDIIVVDSNGEIIRQLELF